jgi:hypothetical protein
MLGLLNIEKNYLVQSQCPETSKKLNYTKSSCTTNFTSDEKHS